MSTPGAPRECRGHPRALSWLNIPGVGQSWAGFGEQIWGLGQHIPRVPRSHCRDRAWHSGASAAPGPEAAAGQGRARGRAG